MPIDILPLLAPAEFEIDLERCREWVNPLAEQLGVVAGPMNGAVVVQHLDIVDRAASPHPAADMALRSRRQHRADETIVDGKGNFDLVAGQGVGAAGPDRFPKGISAQGLAPHGHASVPVAARVGAVMIGRANRPHQVPLRQAILVGATPISRPHGVQIRIGRVGAFRAAVHRDDLHDGAERRIKGFPVDAPIAPFVADVVGDGQRIDALLLPMAQRLAHFAQRARRDDGALRIFEINVVIAVLIGMPLEP